MSTKTANAGTENETRSIQFWPSGKGYTYRPKEDGGYLVIRATRDRKFWESATPEEAREIRVNELAEMYANRDILCCDSHLVSDMLRHAPEIRDGEIAAEWQYEEILNLYPDPSEWDIHECRDYLDEHGINHPDVVDDGEEDTLEAWRDAVRDNAEPAEIYEWWRVTEWLAEQLQAIGQPVLRNGYGTWWGRTCTGQDYLMDGTLQAVAARFVS